MRQSCIMSLAGSGQPAPRLNRAGQTIEPPTWAGNGVTIMLRTYESNNINVVICNNNRLAYIEGVISHYADEDESRVLVYCEGFHCEMEGEFGDIYETRGMDFNDFVETVAFFDEDAARRIVCDRMTGYEASCAALDYLVDVFAAVDPYALQTAIDCCHVFMCDECDAHEFEQDGASVYLDAAIEGQAVVIF